MIPVCDPAGHTAFFATNLDYERLPLVALRGDAA